MFFELGIEEDSNFYSQISYLASFQLDDRCRSLSLTDRGRNVYQADAYYVPRICTPGKRKRGSSEVGAVLHLH